jgi:peptidase M28-like protein
VPHDEWVPSEDRIYSWIETVFARGVRRPGYTADRWAENWIAEQFTALGLESVRREAVQLPSWTPRRAELRAWNEDGGRSFEVECFALPHCASAVVEAELVPFRAASPERVRGSVSLAEVTLMRLPHVVMQGLASWTYDPGDTFAGGMQVLPFARETMAVMEPSAAAGAVGFVGVLHEYPGDSFEYYVPYDGVARALPGVWVRDSDGARLARLLERGRVHARLEVEAERDTITCHNIVAELPGADAETVIIGSHHDGPWSSAVEDGSGIALVLAQAAYWSRVPRAERPHRLVFLLNAGHMAGGAGTRSFIDAHRAELDSVVLEVHLEHAANEIAERDGGLEPTGHPEARWWFTTSVPHLEATVRGAIESEGLGRSLLLRPDVFGPHPTTDGGFFHLEGVPLVNYLTAPFYLFDAMDTLDKIHRASLVPVTRAAVRIIESTSGVSAAAMRSK